jgi:hypothetical protein
MVSGKYLISVENFSANSKKKDSEKYNEYQLRLLLGSGVVGGGLGSVPGGPL